MTSRLRSASTFCLLFGLTTVFSTLAFTQPTSEEEAHQLLAQFYKAGKPQDILGITEQTSKDEARKAFRKLIVRWHEDRTPEPALRKLHKAISIILNFANEAVQEGKQWKPPRPGESPKANGANSTPDQGRQRRQQKEAESRNKEEQRRRNEERRKQREAAKKKSPEEKANILREKVLRAAQQTVNANYDRVRSKDVNHEEAVARVIALKEVTEPDFWTDLRILKADRPAAKKHWDEVVMGFRASADPIQVGAKNLSEYLLFRYNEQIRSGIGPAPAALTVLKAPMPGNTFVQLQSKMLARQSFLESVRPQILEKFGTTLKPIEFVEIAGLVVSPEQRIGWIKDAYQRTTNDDALRTIAKLHFSTLTSWSEPPEASVVEFRAYVCQNPSNTNDVAPFLYESLFFGRKSTEFPADTSRKLVGYMLDDLVARGNPSKSLDFVKAIKKHGFLTDPELQAKADLFPRPNSMFKNCAARVVKAWQFTLSLLGRRPK